MRYVSGQRKRHGRRTSGVNGSQQLPDLGRAGRVQVHQQSIILPASVEILDGGLSQGTCTVHLRVIDVAHGAAWLVPCDTPFVRNLAGQLLKLAAQHDGVAAEGDEDDSH